MNVMSQKSSASCHIAICQCGSNCIDLYWNLWRKQMLTNHHDACYIYLFVKCYFVIQGRKDV